MDMGMRKIVQYTYATTCTLIFICTCTSIYVYIYIHMYIDLLISLSLSRFLSLPLFHAPYLSTIQESCARAVYRVYV